MEPDAGVTRDPDIDVPHRDLIEKAASFSHAFLRWLDGASGQLTYPRLRVLEVLHCRGPAKMKDLADDLGLTARNLTTLADGLETDGLVRRTSHPSDRRATLLELTDPGVAAAECSLAPRLIEISQLFDELSPPQRARLQRSLDTLLAAMDAGSHTDAGGPAAERGVATGPGSIPRGARSPATPTTAPAGQR